jgi:hypothetical protein
MAGRSWSGLEPLVGQGLVSLGGQVTVWLGAFWHGGLGSVTRGMARQGWSRRSGFGTASHGQSRGGGRGALHWVLLWLGPLSRGGHGMIS